MGFLDIWYNSFVFVVFCSDWEALNPFIKKTLHQNVGVHLESITRGPLYT